MRNKFYIVLFFSVICNAQNLCVKNKLTNESIPFASLTFLKNSKTVHFNYTNNKGCLSIKNEILFDSLKVSCVGFKEMWIKEVIDNNLIFLEEKIEILKEIELSENIKESIIIGDLTKNNIKKRQLAFLEKVAWAKYFPNQNSKNYTIKSILLNLFEVKYRTAIGLKFYKKKVYETYKINYKDNNKKVLTSTIIPGEEITTKNSFFYIEKNTKGIFEIDLSDLDLEIPEDGVFVSIYLLDYYDENGNEIEIKNVNNKTKIKTNKTREENYCQKEFLLDGTEWINVNNWFKCDELYFFKNLRPYYSKFSEPTFAIKVKEYN